MKIIRYLDSLSSLENKTILVTGATSGIGLCLANQILYKKGKLVILARNLNKANKVKEDLLNKYPGAYIDIIEFDQSKKTLMDKALVEVINKYKDFYALVINAGIYMPDANAVDEEGYTLTYSTNGIGLYYFFYKIIPYLTKEQRVILQGSFVSGWNQAKKVDLKDTSYPLHKQYVISKSMVESLYYHHLNTDNNYSLYLTEPGFTKTELTKNLSKVLKKFLAIVMAPLYHSTEKASLTIMKALDKDTIDKSYIVPRGALTYVGFPAIRKFPKKRRREYLYNLVKEAI